jgi:hypothetical protein
VEALEGMAADEVVREVESLKRLGLLFEEDGYSMSLVMRPDAAEEMGIGPEQLRARTPFAGAETNVSW